MTITLTPNNASSQPNSGFNRPDTTSVSMFAQLSPSMLAFALLVVLSFATFIQTARKRFRMPPGPVGVPLLGNKHQMPAVKPWVKFAELNKQYGELCFSSGTDRRVESGLVA